MNNVSSLPLLLKQLKLMTILKSWEDIEKIIVNMFDQMENFDESEVRKVVNFHN